MLKEEGQTWLGFVLEILILIAIVLGIRFYIFQLFRVAGPSMCPTLNMINDKCVTAQNTKGEFIFVNEFLYRFVRDPKRGEVVVFKAPEKKVSYIKRILGIPGDTIEIKDGKIFLSNKEVTKQEIIEPYLSPKNQGMTHSSGKTRFTVPEDHYLLLGDNRSKSLDSRNCFASCDGKHTPFLPKENIQGVAEFVIWPPWDEGLRKIANPFETEKSSEISLTN